jgi:hypothetical protein
MSFFLTVAENCMYVCMYVCVCEYEIKSQTIGIKGR